MSSMPLRLRARRVLATCAATALAALAVPIVTGAALPAAHADGSSITVTGANYAWDAVDQVPMGALPTATVDQTANLTDQVVHVSWANFTPSSNDSSDAIPNPGTVVNTGNTLYAVSVVECRGTPSDSPADLTKACYNYPAGTTIGSHGLGNQVEAITRADGSGTADFHVETAVANDLLGCDATHPCSLVLVPGWGGNDNQDTVLTSCDDHSQDYPDDANDYSPTAFGGDGSAIDTHLGAPCSWANRLVVPLSFAPTPTNCPAAALTFATAGSPMLERAMSQWQAGWCQGSGAVHFDYDSGTNEYQARSSFLGGGQALSSSTDIAFTTQPASGGTRKFTYAPIANTDIAIAFVVDDPLTGTVIQHLTLDARLVAKMLTTSYTGYFSCQDGSLVAGSGCDPAVHGNPQDIFDDPEFQALNPTITPGHYTQSPELLLGAGYPTVVAGNSDLTYELTRWIASDPDAKSFLAGKPDPWGTRINDKYKGVVQYPTSQLSNLDPGYTDPASGDPGNGTMQNAWQPVTGLDRVGTLLVGNTSTALTFDCEGYPTCSHPKLHEVLGARALFAILDQGQAAAYKFPTASLVNASGTAVAPTTATVSAGLHDSTANPDGITRQANVASTDPMAYPLAVTDYAMVPTCGLSTSVANGISAMLGKVSSSQLYGVTPGTIAPGYLALSDVQLGQLGEAQSAVSTQSCATPPPSSGGSATTPPGRAGSGGSDQGGQGSGQTTSTSTPATSSSTAPAAGTATPPTSVTPSQPAARLAANEGVKKADTAGPMRFALPVLLIAGLVMLLVGPALYVAFAVFGRTS